MSQAMRSAMFAAAIAAGGVLAALGTAVAVGMGVGETAHVAALLAPAAAITVLATVAAPQLLRRASLSSRLAAVAVVAIVVALANLGALAFDMIVGEHDAKVLAILLVYSLGAGMAVAAALARAPASALARLGRTAETLGRGDLEARVGELAAGTEVDALAVTLDGMADQLQRARAREQREEAMRNDLITAVSHDLRTPLASLRAMIEAIDDAVVTDVPTLRRYAAEMRQSVNQLSTMVDDLFELAQLDAGAIEAETRRARLDDIVRSVVATVEPHASRKRLVLQTDLGEAGQACCSPRMTRVLQNLLMNAIRHTPADGTVRVCARRDLDHLEVAVEDSGMGLPNVDTDRLFEPFFRADPARSGPGAGLGLALAKRIVEGVGGRIRAETISGGGARFAIDLPVSS